MANWWLLNLIVSLSFSRFRAWGYTSDALALCTFLFGLRPRADESSVDAFLVWGICGMCLARGQWRSMFYKKTMTVPRLRKVQLKNMNKIGNIFCVHLCILAGARRTTVMSWPSLTAHLNLWPYFLVAPWPMPEDIICLTDWGYYTNGPEPSWKHGLCMPLFFNLK